MFMLEVADSIGWLRIPSFCISLTTLKGCKELFVVLLSSEID